MASTSKSPVAIVNAALAVARRSLPMWSHPNSPKKFTQHQLFACLVLKSAMKTDYRGVAAMLRDSSDLREAMGLFWVPHFTTLQKAAARLLISSKAKRLLDATVREHMGRRSRVSLAAIDSTGIECTSASAYFARRRSRGEKKAQTVRYHR